MSSTFPRRIADETTACERVNRDKRTSEGKNFSAMRITFGMYLKQILNNLHEQHLYNHTTEKGEI